MFRSRKTKGRAASIKVLESDVPRMQEEMNFRMFLDTDGCGQMLWVEKIEVSGADRSGQEQKFRNVLVRKYGIIRDFIKRLINR